MRSSTLYTLLASAAILDGTLAVPVQVSPGDVSDLSITYEDTLNSTNSNPQAGLAASSNTFKFVPTIIPAPSSVQAANNASATLAAPNNAGGAMRNATGSIATPLQLNSAADSTLHTVVLTSEITTLITTVEGTVPTASAQQDLESSTREESSTSTTSSAQIAAAPASAQETDSVAKQSGPAADPLAIASSSKAAAPADARTPSVLFPPFGPFESGRPFVPFFAPLWLGPIAEELAASTSALEASVTPASGAADDSIPTSASSAIAESLQASATESIASASVSGSAAANNLNTPPALSTSAAASVTFTRFNLTTNSTTVANVTAVILSAASATAPFANSTANSFNRFTAANLTSTSAPAANSTDFASFAAQNSTNTTITLGGPAAPIPGYGFTATSQATSQAPQPSPVTQSSAVAQSSAVNSQPAATSQAPQPTTVTPSSTANSQPASTSQAQQPTTSQAQQSTTSQAPQPQSSTSQAPEPVPSGANSANGNLAINLVNKMDNNNMKVYLSGLDTNGQLILLGQDGGWFYPTASGGVPEPLPTNAQLNMGGANTTLSIVTPGYIRSARIWVSEGPLQFFTVSTPNGPGLVQPAAVNPHDPNAEVNYGFAEFDWEQASGLYADITAVDFVGLPLGIKLSDTEGKTFSALGLPADAAPQLCQMLQNQEKSNGPDWGNLCTYKSDGTLLRVLAPSNLVAQNGSSFQGMFDSYVDAVWSHYTTNDLIINTQAAPGNVTCRVSNDQLNCAGDNRPYPRPTAADIFGCNTGPFSIEAGDNGIHYAVVPRLCAAFNRATFLTEGGNVQPGQSPSMYYQSSPNNWYSAFTHQIEEGGKGYAFAYDDVAPYGDDTTAGLLATTTPSVLTVYVGGW